MLGVTAASVISTPLTDATDPVTSRRCCVPYPMTTSSSRASAVSAMVTSTVVVWPAVTVISRLSVARPMSCTIRT